MFVSVILKHRNSQMQLLLAYTVYYGQLDILACFIYLSYCAVQPEITCYAIIDHWFLIDVGIASDHFKGNS